MNNETSCAATLTCARCHGSGRDPDNKDCWMCYGRGEINWGAVNESGEVCITRQHSAEVAEQLKKKYAPHQFDARHIP